MGKSYNSEDTRFFFQSSREKLVGEFLVKESSQKTEPPKSKSEVVVTAALCLFFTVSTGSVGSSIPNTSQAASPTYVSTSCPKQTQSVSRGRIVDMSVSAGKKYNDVAVNAVSSTAYNGILGVSMPDYGIPWEGSAMTEKNAAAREQQISKTYLIGSVALSVVALVSLLSVVGLKFLPSPIDTTLFWTTFAGAVGLALDKWKRERWDVS